MTRKIKFRAWDGNKMYYNPEFKGAGHTFEEIFSIPYERMQYTGLKDKNGKEIYEGDIVKRDDASKGKYWRFAEVIKEPGHFTFYTIPTLCINCFKIDRVKFRMGGFSYCPDTSSMGNVMEIVGNIYENPELLNPKQNENKTTKEVK